ncbi:DUF2163 domain-containing protein [Emcibacter nanhaiensis]|uniref:DUF2163 domain-containing protein n=1 Tax=Emcibacter nanhaiensis TaxID=1505037 RepID=A0A501PC22_9PROT|nr:DUF2163 domain-containing protein [Emcibacter nanhaiensis]TPD57738.1 DUF2163 domain-containing protein [Emcibacter nanhaiensis]
MKTISQELRQHLQEEVLTLAWCCVLTRTDGVHRAFTSHDRPVVMDGQRFVPTSGFIPTDISSSNAFNVDNLDITAILSHNSISEQDILAGRYDHARVEIFRVNWAAPDMGRIDMRSGWLGEISLADTDFTVEIRGLMQRLQQTVGQQYSPECRAILGSATCHADLLKHSRVGRVSAVTGTAAFAADDITEPDGWFDYGLLWWISGRNAGLKVEIKTYSSGAFALCEVMPNPIEAGDRFKAQAGCDKRTVTCRDKFDNFRNFRGEPMVPGSDSLYYYPGLK